MTRHLKHSERRTRSEIVGAPILPRSRACDDHSFEMPAVLYLTMAGLLSGPVWWRPREFSRRASTGSGNAAS